jgi:hypothetical protein
MVELATFPSLAELRARLADEDLSCPPAVALVIARELARSLELCFEHGLCPEILPLANLSVSPRGELIVRPGPHAVRDERDAVLAMSHALLAFASPSPAIDPLCRVLASVHTFRVARELIEIEIDRSGLATDTQALTRLVDYLLQKPKQTLASLPLFDRRPELTEDDAIAVIEPARVARKPRATQEEIDPNAWFLRVVPRAMRHAPGPKRGLPQ